MDFAFAPGVTDYDDLARQLFTNRPHTRLIQGRGLRTVSGFLNQLNTATGITLPADDLFIATHGNDRAWMQIPLDSTQIHSTKTDPTVYETVEAAVTSGSVKIPGQVNHDSGGNLNSMSVNFRGCRIGAATPFVDKLKEAFGNESPVTAARHFHDIYRFPGQGGLLEYLEYSFGVLSKTAFANKAAVVKAFTDHTPAFTYKDGTTAVLPALWSDWIPKNVSVGHRDSKDVSLVLGRTLAGQTVIPDAIEFRHDVPRPYTYKIGGLTALPAEADQPEKLREALNADAGNPGSLFASAHPFPVYERWGQSNIDDFVDNLAWKFSWDARNKVMICAGTQHEYTVLVPVTDPPDLGTGKLIYNFYPPTGSTDPAVDELLTSDGTMFYTA